MKTIIVTAVALGMTVSACDRTENSVRGNTAASNASVSADAVAYSGTGKVTAIADNQVTIAHGPIEGIGWPAMTMTFTAPEGLAEGVAVGAQVDFSFHKDGGTYVLTSLRKR